MPLARASGTLPNSQRRGFRKRKSAFQTGLATGTVKIYLSTRVYVKLGVGSQAELIRYWIERVEMPNRGDCSNCCLRQNFGARASLPILE
jgi:hypothetical protein